MKKKHTLLILLIIPIFSCKKQLEVKPSSVLQVPVTASDFQAILNNTNNLSPGSPFAGTAGADEGFVTDQTYATGTLTERNAYIWDRNVFNDNARNDWSLSYNIVYISNIALEGVSKYGDETDQWSNIKGQASFFRGSAYYQLAQEFCKPYDSQTANTDPGIVLRHTADLNTKSVRSTVAASYAQMITDLYMAAKLLPVDVPTKIRPGKAAAYSMLARTYLSMRLYDKAGLYADSCLQLNAKLLDYNQVTSTPSPSFTRFNDEVISYAIVFPTAMLLPNKYLVDTTLYTAYEASDLRKKLFFKALNGTPYYTFNGSYDGSIILFSGTATDEMYLIRAESYARAGNTAACLADLNTLKKNRYQKIGFQPFAVNDAGEALKLVLLERRRELCLRGLRWTDLRRLNKEPAYQTTLEKSVNGHKYILMPDDARYTWPIPQDVINNTGIAQN